MDWLAAPDYYLARLVIQRGLGVIYLLAFAVAINQFRPLLGERGLLPVPRYVRLAGWSRAPSLFTLHYCDRLLGVVAWTGAGLAALVVLGLPEQGPVGVSMLVWFALWVLYLSIVNVGQTFYGFGWESLLLEAGFLAIFLGPADIAPPLPVIILLRWLLFRVEFGAGLIKLRGDRCWRRLTCLDYHHETQPMPNPLSWWFHRLPAPLHRVEVAANHVTQLVVPFLLFTPQPYASVAGVVMIVTQGWLVLSGNFSWLNVVTMTLAFSALDNRILENGAAGLAPGAAARPTGLVRWPGPGAGGDRRGPQLVAGAQHALVAPGHEPQLQPPAPGQHLRRLRDRQPGAPRGRDRGHRRRGHHADHRLAALRVQGEARRSPPPPTAGRALPPAARLADVVRGAVAGLRRALAAPAGGEAAGGRRGARSACSAGGATRSPTDPPAFVRARLFRYRYTTRAERRTNGAWWVRTEVGIYLPPVRRAPKATRSRP